ncbi:MAG: hypothetical protein ACE37K_21010 [Planctomycetota bacterium]
MSRPFAGRGGAALRTSSAPSLALAALLLATGGTAAAQSPQPEPDVVDAEQHEARGVRLKAAIDAGHDWLKAHQEADGRFSASMFVVHDPRGKPCDGPGKPDQDVFVTALVVKSWNGMAWLPDAGGDNGEGTHPHVVKATEWLFAQVQEDGSVGLPNASTLVRDTGAAGEVLHWACIYHGGWKGRWQPRKTIEWLKQQALDRGRWPAQPGSRSPDWAADTLVTSCLQVLGGVGGGVEGNGPFAAGGALRRCTPAELGGAAYVFTWAVRNQELRAEACRQALQHLPKVHTRADAVDYFGWYCATQGMQFEPAEAWRTWWHALVDVALRMQRTDGSFAGSWDPLDVRGREGGRVYATACMLLALEVAWRKEYRDR